MHRVLSGFFLLFVVLAGCASPGPGEPSPEAVSLLGERLERPAIPEGRRAELEANLASALERFELEPDGAPNPSGIPTSSTWFNIQYHLGLAHFLKADYETALNAWRASLESPLTNDDKLVAASHWQWNCLVRLGREEEARRLAESIPGDLELLENHSYANCLALYRDGNLSNRPEAPKLSRDPSAAAYAFGFASWLREQGAPEEAEDLLREIVAHTNWAAFGHVAAEAELARAR